MAKDARSRKMTVALPASLVDKLRILARTKRVQSANAAVTMSKPSSTISDMLTARVRRRSRNDRLSVVRIQNLPITTVLPMTSIRKAVAASWLCPRERAMNP